MTPEQSRRSFLQTLGIAGAGLAIGCNGVPKRASGAGKIMTVLGPVDPARLGTTLIHEHVTTDFIGADRIPARPRYDRDEAFDTIVPHLRAARAAGVDSIFECTPRFIGRDVVLLRRLAASSGLHIVTNTGYYGAVGNRYLPEFVQTESEEQLAVRWLSEWEHGIEGTDIRPGFIKLGTDRGKLPPLHVKLVRAAARVHRETGLTICIHTGDAEAARDEVRILREAGVAADAFVWVHAQNDGTGEGHLEIARQGGWISLDGYGVAGDKPQNYLKALLRLRGAGLLGRVLISHDNGWAVDGENMENAPLKSWTDEGVAPYLGIFERLLPDLRDNGFTDSDIDRLLIRNPAECFRVHKRLA